jgi:LEA14-like dessication related protein
MAVLTFSKRTPDGVRCEIVRNMAQNMNEIITLIRMYYPETFPRKVKGLKIIVNN